MRDLENSVVFITGGTSGYGKAMAKAFRAKGARVIIAARHEDRLAEARAEIGDVDTLKMDVTDYAAWAALPEWISAHYGRIDVLINNAGGGVAIRPVDTQSKEEINAALSLNLASVIYASSVMAPVFKAQKSGTIINVSSVCATHCWPEWSVYAAAKAGVRNFSKSLYTELQPYGVRVSCIIPAAAATGFHKAAHMDSIKAASSPRTSPTPPSTSRPCPIAPWSRRSPCGAWIRSSRRCKHPQSANHAAVSSFRLAAAWFRI